MIIGFAGRLDKRPTLRSPEHVPMGLNFLSRNDKRILPILLAKLAPGTDKQILKLVFRLFVPV